MSTVPPTRIHPNHLQDKIDKLELEARRAQDQANTLKKVLANYKEVRRNEELDAKPSRIFWFF